MASLLESAGTSRLGFYVDVGAHHPVRCSNTYFFYKRGWTGINIDAMPGSMREFSAIRPRDINVEAAVSDEAKSLIYYEFNEPLLNGFSKELSCSRNGLPGWKIIGERQIAMVRLADLLARHVPAKQPIDFLSVDVEGLDLAVLRSNDWVLFRPALVLVEDIDIALMNSDECTPTMQFLKDLDYGLCCRTRLTSIFIDRHHLERTSLGLRLRRPV